MSRIGRVLTLAGILAGCAAVPLLWPTLKPPLSISEPLHAPWIGLPPVVMDAGSAYTRAVLRRAAMSGSDLVERCGWHTNDATERYVAHLGDPSLQRDARYWRIELEVQGDWIQVLVANAVFPPPPPPPSPSECPVCGPFVDVPAKTASARLEKAELEPIAQAWRDPRLWATPQANPHCTDGIPAFLQACVAGRYAAFNRNCDDDGMNAAMELWSVVQDLLPPPPQ